VSKRVVVIGGGVVGLCAAYYLKARGFDVTVVDREPRERSSCSYGNAGLVVPSHFVPLAAPGMVALGLRCMFNAESPFYLKPRISPRLASWGWKFWRAATKAQVQKAAPVLRDLSLASRVAYDELAGSLGHDFGLAHNGVLLLCQTEHALHEEATLAEEARRLGMPAEVLDAKQTAAKDPAITMDILGSVYYPLDCHLSPMQLMAALQSQLEAAGVAFHWNTEITAWHRDGARLTAIVSASNRFEADEFVLAAGVWSDDMARKLSLNIPMQAGKGYSLTLPAPRQLPKIPSLLMEARVAVTPMGGSLRFGGTMELAGIDRTINPPRIRGIVKSAVKYFPEFRESDFDGVQPWCGLRPCSPDGLPYVGRSNTISNLTIDTGHAMLGVSLGPISGKIVANLVASEPPPLEIGMLSPERYG
jgi:D-amino-acid dehydrogenase